MRRRRAAVIGVLLLAALGLWVVTTAHGGDPRLFPGPAGAARTEIFLIDNGFHTDLVIPGRSLIGRRGALAQAAALTTARPWIAIGWGDERFYTQSGFGGARAVDGLRSLFLPGNPSVVRIEGLALRPDRLYADGVRAIVVTDVGLARLEDRVDNSLALGPGGAPVRARRPDQAETTFFKSVEHFSLLHLCNHWTSDLLHAAGLPTTPVLDTIPAGLLLDLRVRAGV